MANVSSLPVFHAVSALKEPGLGIVRLKAAISRHLERRRRYRATFNELIALDDRELADLGIPRCHISRLAREQMEQE